MGRAGGHARNWAPPPCVLRVPPCRTRSTTRPRPPAHRLRAMHSNCDTMSANCGDGSGISSAAMLVRARTSFSRHVLQRPAAAKRQARALQRPRDEAALRPALQGMLQRLRRDDEALQRQEHQRERAQDQHRPWRAPALLEPPRRAQPTGPNAMRRAAEAARATMGALPASSDGQDSLTGAPGQLACRAVDARAAAAAATIHAGGAIHCAGEPRRPRTGAPAALDSTGRRVETGPEAEQARAARLGALWHHDHPQALMRLVLRCMEAAANGTRANPPPRRACAPPIASDAATLAAQEGARAADEPLSDGDEALEREQAQEQGGWQPRLPSAGGRSTAMRASARALAAPSLPAEPDCSAGCQWPARGDLQVRPGALPAPSAPAAAAPHAHPSAAVALALRGVWGEADRGASDASATNPLPLPSHSEADFEAAYMRMVQGLGKVRAAAHSMPISTLIARR